MEKYQRQAGTNGYFLRQRGDTTNDDVCNDQKMKDEPDRGEQQADRGSNTSKSGVSSRVSLLSSSIPIISTSSSSPHAYSSFAKYKSSSRSSCKMPTSCTTTNSSTKNEETPASDEATKISCSRFNDKSTPRTLPFASHKSSQVVPSLFVSSVSSISNSSSATATTSSSTKVEAAKGVNNDSSTSKLVITDTATSIKRSFDILNSLDLTGEYSGNKRRRTYEDTTPEIFCGAGSYYAKEWTQEEKDRLVAFANKYIINCDSLGDDSNGGGGGGKDEEKNDMSEKKRRTL